METTFKLRVKGIVMETIFLHSQNFSVRHYENLTMDGEFDESKLYNYRILIRHSEDFTGRDLFKTEIKNVTLAINFMKILNEWLSPAEIAEINRKNENEYKGTGACATHDFCDPNQAMIDAWKTVFKKNIDHGSDTDCDFINEAWAIARRMKFSLTPVKA